MRSLSKYNFLHRNWNRSLLSKRTFTHTVRLVRIAPVPAPDTHTQPPRWTDVEHEHLTEGIRVQAKITADPQTMKTTDAHLRREVVSSKDKGVAA